VVNATPWPWPWPWPWRFTLNQRIELARADESPSLNPEGCVNGFMQLANTR